jgi:carbohydrate-binding DOMON domain-containing protein
MGRKYILNAYILKAWRQKNLAYAAQQTVHRRAMKNGPEGPFLSASEDAVIAVTAYRPAWRVNDTLGFL